MKLSDCKVLIIEAKEDKLGSLLEKALATVFALYFKTHNYHWNVEGEHFQSYHKLFNDIYDDLYESVDTYAEQLRVLQIKAPVGLKTYAALSVVADATGETLEASKMVADLLADFETTDDVLNDVMKEATKQDEQGLMNFLAGRIEQHKKWAWMLRSITRGAK